MTSVLLELIIGYLEHGPEPIKQVINMLPEQLALNIILNKPALYHNVKNPTQSMTVLYQALTTPKNT